MKASPQVEVAEGMNVRNVKEFDKREDWIGRRNGRGLYEYSH
jgi:hypothetical protein